MQYRRATRRLFAVGASAFALLGAHDAATAAAKSDCEVPPSAAVDTPKGVSRPVEIDDLVRLRDVGLPGEFLPDQSPFAVSPDGRKVAFSIRRADPSSNDYCQALYVINLDGVSQPRLVDSGGEYIRYTFDDLRGLVFPTGSAKVITPAWSPDGVWIAYLRRQGGRAQAWLVAASGGSAAPVTSVDFDVDAVSWTPDGKLIFSGSPALEAQHRAIAKEALTGYQVDARVVPMGGPTPYPRSPVEREWFVLDVATGHERRATAEEQSSRSSRPQFSPARARLLAYGKAGQAAWAAPQQDKGRFAPSNLYAATAANAVKQCLEPRCRGTIVDLGWTADEREIWFLRREGPGNSQLGLFRWNPTAGNVRRLLETIDVLGNCTTAGRNLICLREAPTLPRHLVAIRLDDGRVRRIVGVNPEFERLRFGHVRRLYWRNDDGLVGYGDLILPVDHRPGQKHPLVIVQYRTRGFLRGAVGDLYPIQAFAARGMAVLSVEGPPSLAETQIARGQLAQTVDEARQDMKGWSDRRNILASLLHGLSAALATGTVDPRRVGVSGTSEGAVSTWFAIINAPGTFAAASIGSCCADPKTLMAASGEALQNHWRQIGYPRYLDDDPAFWRPISIAQNAKTINVPLLIQIPSEEFGTAVESFTSLKEAGKDVALYVFPDENHYIWQPAHRRAIYARNLEWFCEKLECGRK